MTQPEASVTPILSPDAAAMTRQLEHLFGGDLDGLHDGLIELAWQDGKDGALRHAELFSTDQIEDLVAKACKVNAVPGQNTYFGSALRKPGTAPFGRCEDSDFYALPAYYVDLDDAGIAEHAKHRYRGCLPTLVVVTGRRPHLRAQLWWRHETPERDPAYTRAQLVALAAAFNGDPTVVNPSRVMRLAGSIAWPKKEGRVLEVTELQVFDDRASIYTNGELKRAFPVDQVTFPVGNVTTPVMGNPITEQHQQVALAAHVTPSAAAVMHLALSPFTGTSPDELIARIRAAGGGWHNDVLRLVGHWIMRGATDDEILLWSEPLTLTGFTVAKTRDEVAVMLRGGRAKWHQPNPRIDLDGASASPAIGPIEILDLAGIAAIPPVTWLVEDYLPERSFGLIYSPPSSYKSFLTLDLLLHIAYGRVWHDKAVKTGAVLYVAGEGAGGIKKRILAWRRHHGLLDIWAPFYAIRTGLNLADLSQVPLLLAAIQAKAEASKVEFVAVAIDTVARAMVGSDENDAKEMGLFIAACDRVRNTIGAMILGVHHSGKDKERGARGSTALPGASDCILRLDRTEGTSTVSVIVEKQKDDEEAQPLRLTAIKVNTDDLNLGAETSLVMIDMNQGQEPQNEQPRLSKNQARRTMEEIDRAWREKQPWGNTVQTKRDGRYLPMWMAREFGCDPELAAGYIAEWMMNGFVVKEMVDTHSKRLGLRLVRHLD